jgi:hypothetical protein
MENMGGVRGNRSETFDLVIDHELHGVTRGCLTGGEEYD